MPTYNSINAAKVAAVPSQKIQAGEIKGDLTFAYDQYTSTVALAAADIINTGIVIPAGALVKSVVVVSPTNGGTVSAGITGTATKYVNAGTAGATTEVNSLVRTTADETLILTIGGSPSAAGIYKVAVVFSLY